MRRRRGREGKKTVEVSKSTVEMTEFTWRWLLNEREGQGGRTEKGVIEQTNSSMKFLPIVLSFCSCSTLAAATTTCSLSHDDDDGEGKSDYA